jgi:hypothetical protein
MTNGKLASFRLIQKTLLDKSTGCCIPTRRSRTPGGRSRGGNPAPTVKGDRVTDVPQLTSAAASTPATCAAWQ